MKKLFLCLSAVVMLTTIAAAWNAVSLLPTSVTCPVVCGGVNFKSSYLSDSLPSGNGTRPARKPEFRRGSVAAEVRGFFVPLYEEGGDQYSIIGSLTGGYFVINRFLVGVTATFLNNRHHEYIYFDMVKYNERDWFYGPLIRYHFGESRVSGFMEISYQWGRSGYHFKDKYRAYSRSYPEPSYDSYLIFTPGLNVRLSENVRATATIALMKDLSISGVSVDGFLPQLGLCYTFKPFF